MLVMIDRGQDFRTALEQVGRYFMGTADVQVAADRLAAKLDELGIPYAICGGIALAAYNHVRATTDVDVLVTPAGLQKFKQHALGLGWIERFPGSRGLRDADRRVPIDFLLTGGFPGDGQPRSLAFPDPAAAAVDHGGKKVLALPRLIELKLASGMYAPDRLQDLADVLQLIRANALPADYAARLHVDVQAKYREIWNLAQRPAGEY